MHVNSRPSFTALKRKQALNTPLRFASVQNRSYQGATNSSGKNRYFFRWKHVLGANMGTLAIGALNWHIQSGGQTNTGNGWTYEGISIEGPTGTVVPVRWAGASTKTLADGDNNIVSDEIPASAFGTTLDKGDEIWLKGIISLSSGQYIPYGWLLPDYSNTQTGFYDSTVTTPSSINAAGVFTFTGTAPSGIFNVHSPILLGRPHVDGPSYLGIGDSILFGLADNGSQGVFGRGFMQRAMHDGSFGSPVPSCNFSASGVPSGAFTGGNTKWKSWAAYATRGIEESLTNDVDILSVAQMKTSVQSIWSSMKTAGIQKIIRTGLMARTNTTDSWATSGNQTPINANWDTGGKVDQMNAWFSTRVGTDIEAFSDMAGVLDTDPNLWEVNGTAQRMTNDGTHLYDNGANAIGNATAGTALRNTRTALN